MTALPGSSGVSTTHQFKRQLESFCRIERISTEAARLLGKSVIEGVCRAHGENTIFSPSGCKVPVSIKLENGEIAKLLIVFDEPAPGWRAIRKILSARMVRRQARERELPHEHTAAPDHADDPGHPVGVERQGVRPDSRRD